jgi:hypothetical protein
MCPLMTAEAVMLVYKNLFLPGARTDQGLDVLWCSYLGAKMKGTQGVEQNPNIGSTLDALTACAVIDAVVAVKFVHEGHSYDTVKARVDNTRAVHHFSEFSFPSSARKAIKGVCVAGCDSRIQPNSATPISRVSPGESRGHHQAHNGKKEEKLQPVSSRRLSSLSGNSAVHAPSTMLDTVHIRSVTKHNSSKQMGHSSSTSRVAETWMKIEREKGVHGNKRLSGKWCL